MMKVVYLPSTQDDFEWFYRYYTEVFPEGAKNALHQFDAMEGLLSSSPFIGAIKQGDVREFSIPNIPFSYIYRIRDDQVQVLRVWDERRKPSNTDY